MLKWPWNKCKVTNVGTYDWPEPNIQIMLKCGNPLDQSHIYVYDQKYTVEESQIYYKIIEKNTRSMMFAIDRNWVENVIINSDLQ